VREYLVQFEDETGIGIVEYRELMAGGAGQAGGAALRKQARLEIAELKKKPCMDCGKKYPAYVMDFDHRPGEAKVGNISQLINLHPLKALAEVEKCDLICSNCHRERTHGGRR
jgi:hypothetical protein